MAQAPILDSSLREDGTVVMSVGRRDLAQARVVLTPEGRGSAHIQEIADSLYHPETVSAILISRRQERSRE